MVAVVAEADRSSSLLSAVYVETAVFSLCNFDLAAAEFLISWLGDSSITSIISSMCSGSGGGMTVELVLSATKEFVVVGKSDVSTETSTLLCLDCNVDERAEADRLRFWLVCTLLPSLFTVSNIDENSNCSLLISSSRARALCVDDG